MRWPAAVAFIKENKLNEFFAGEMRELGIICQGGMYNAVIRALQTLGLADAFGASRVPIYCMNVTYPMVPEEIVAFCRPENASPDRRGRPARLHRGAGARHACGATT